MVGDPRGGQPDRVHTDLPAAVRLTATSGQRAVVVLAGLLLIALVVGIALVLVSLERTRADVRTTRADVTDVTDRVQRLDGQLAPLLTSVGALTTAAGGPKLRTGLRDAGTAVSALPGLARDAETGLDALGLVTDAVGRSDLATVLPAVAAALARAQRPGSGLARGLDGATRLPAGLRDPDVPSQATCDRRLLTRAGIDQLGCVLRTLPNARRLLSDQRRITSRSLRVQLATATVTRRTEALLVQSLGVQRELLVVARSLDRKLPESAAILP